MKSGQPTKKDYVFVVVQILLFVAYILPFKLVTLNVGEEVRYLGLVMVCLGVVLGGVALLQINTNISPFPTPISGAKLLTKGAFSLARHPIYTSILAVTLGYAVYEISLFKCIIFVALGILFYLKSTYEEQLLLEKFPEYLTYKQTTRRFI